jgi:hypothetical protein
VAEGKAKLMKVQNVPLVEVVEHSVGIKFLKVKVIMWNVLNICVA